jgi:toluene monooxygenase system protein B
MAAVPLVVNFEGDFVLQLVGVESASTMDQVAQAAAVHSVGRRVKPRTTGVLRVIRQDARAPFPRGQTVADAGLQPMETVVVFWDKQ